MPISPDAFTSRIMRLKADLVAQSRRVQALVEVAFESVFAGDVDTARRAISMDEPIDHVDVQIEKAAVQLLTDATGSGAALPPEQLRQVLTIVKVNNELERIADAGVNLAEIVTPEFVRSVSLPDTMRVITNSVVGIIRDTGTSLDRSDAHLAKIVLASEDAVEAFKKAILREAQVQVSTGKMTVDMAFTQQELTNLCEIMAEHCTNIAEQILYATTGAIVRHMGGHWEEVPTSPRA
jgi:phosphate transport system protein